MRSAAYLLDSGPLSALLQERPAVVERVGALVADGDVATTPIAYGEVCEYLYRLPDAPQRIMALRRLLREIRPMAISYAVMERYASVRRAMRHPFGTGVIGDMDTLMAAVALERNMILITMDRHFVRVPNLAVVLLSRRD